MRICLIGTGNAAGMPLYGCNCGYCLDAQSSAEKQRTPCSALLEVEGNRYLLDAGQVDLHTRFPAGSLSGIFLTHFHPDHVQGLFHLRWGRNLEIPVYCPPDSQGCADLYKHPGILRFSPLRKFEAVTLGKLKVTPLPLIHSKPTFGYLIQYDARQIAYLTDTKGLPPATTVALKSLELEILIIDCSYAPNDHSKGHNNLNDVIEIQQELAAQKVVLTHIGHDFDAWLGENPSQLPEGFVVGHDGMVL